MRWKFSIDTVWQRSKRFLTSSVLYHRSTSFVSINSELNWLPLKIREFFFKIDRPETIFAPTDAAFAALSPGLLDSLLSDKKKLYKFINNQIVSGYHYSRGLETGPILAAFGVVVDVQVSPGKLKMLRDLIFSTTSNFIFWNSFRENHVRWCQCRYSRHNECSRCHSRRWCRSSNRRGLSCRPEIFLLNYFWSEFSLNPRLFACIKFTFLCLYTLNG
jgi:hypothetical protein